ncbi:hypothetical protein C8R43DRAFT_941229 [Mycena crocata]|nr:hypothetical protein C8R43DRAFT_941229 [Mycena crocata]
MFTTDNFIYPQESHSPVDFMLQPSGSSTNTSGSVFSKRCSRMKPEDFVPYSHDPDSLEGFVVPPWSPSTDTSVDEDDPLPDSDTTCIQINMHLNDPATYGRKLVKTAQIADHAPRANLELSVHIINCMTSAQMRAATAMCMEDMIFRYRARLTDLHLDLDANGLGLFLRLPHSSFPILHTICFVIAEYNESKWFVPARKGLTPPTQMHRIAPELTSFTLDVCDHCDSELDPFDLGLDFSRLVELDLQVGVSQESAHLMLRSCRVLHKCTLRIGPWAHCWFPAGDDWNHLEDFDEWDDKEGNLRRRRESEKALPIILSHLSHFKPFKLPKLASFTLEGTGVLVKHFQGSLVALFQRSEVLLRTLSLRYLWDVTQEMFAQLLKHQHQLKYLDLYYCRGDFWTVMSQNIALAPKLKCLHCRSFSEMQVERLVRFIDSRCDTSGLKDIVLDPLRPEDPPEPESLTDSTFNWLMDKTNQWRNKGFQVKVGSRRSGDPAIDEDDSASDDDSDEYSKEHFTFEDDDFNMEGDNSTTEKTAQYFVD